MAVWGEAFTRLFLDVAVPNQLSSGNLRALPPGCRYRIFTAAEDVERIEGSAAFKALAEVIETDIVVIEGLDGARDRRIRSMTRCHQEAVRQAARCDAGLVFLSPDAVLGEGTLDTVWRLAGTGKRAIMLPGLRLNMDTFLPALRDYLNRVALAAPPPRDLVALALDHLHPITKSLLVGSHRFNRKPAHLYWLVDGEGIIARCFHLHPLMIYPARRGTIPLDSIDGDFVINACPDPSDVYIVNDSDEIAVFEMSPDTKNIGIKGESRFSMLHTAAYGCLRCHSHHRRFFRSRIRLHAGIRSARWRAVERKSDWTAAAILLLVPFGRLLAAYRHWSQARAKVIARESKLVAREHKRELKTAKRDLRARKRAAKARLRASEPEHH